LDWKVDQIKKKTFWKCWMMSNQMKKVEKDEGWKSWEKYEA
jgi:hypothetical protein